MSTTPLVSRGIGGLWKGNPELYVGGLFLGTVIDNLLFGVLMIEVSQFGGTFSSPSSSRFPVSAVLTSLPFLSSSDLDLLVRSFYASVAPSSLLIFIY